MFQPKYLIVAVVASLAVIGFAAPSQAHHHRYSRHGYPNPYAYSFPYRPAYGYFYPPTYYPGPPWYPGPAFYGPLRYGRYYGDDYYQPRRVYYPEW